MAERRRGGGKPGATAGTKPGTPVTPGTPASKDLELWRQVTKTAQPLKGRRLGIRGQDSGSAGETEAPQQPRSNARAPRATPVPIQPQVPPRQARSQAPELAHGTVAGVAKAQAERLRRGQLPIEARLDLHGHTQSEAHSALDDFLAASQRTGKRCVLVVTGRGLAKQDGGVLRRAVPQWLNQPPNRARILAFDQAQPRHGGAGALYVLLKRQRA